VTTFKIECPECHRKYNVGERILGRKVTCSNKSCGTTFLAENIQLSPSIVDVEVPQKSESTTQNVEKVGLSPPPLPSKNKTTPSAESDLQFGPVESAAPSNPKRRQTLILCILAVVPTVALVIGLFFYVKAQSKEATKVASPSAANSPDDLEDKAFHKAVAKTLAYANCSMQSMRRLQDINDRLVFSNAKDYRGFLGGIRSRIPVPPAHLKSRVRIDQQLDLLVETYRTALTHIPMPNAQEKFGNVAEIIDALKSLDGHKLPEETLLAFEETSKIADSIGNDLKISFDDAHRSKEFCENAIEIIEYAKRCIANLERLPVVPNMQSSFDLSLSDADVRGVTILWSHLPDPPEGVANRDKVVAAIAGIHKNLVAADRNHRFAYEAKKLLSDGDFTELRSIYDQSLKNAAKLADEVEPLLRAK
jgi:hypothetical protein